jgi:AraC-like DNA-binding protein
VVVHDKLKNHVTPRHSTTLTVKFAFGGDEYYVTNKCRFRVNEDNFLVLNERCDYESYIDSDNNVESLALFFSPAFVDEAYSAFVRTHEKTLGSYGTDICIERRNIFIEKLYPKDNIIVPLLSKIRGSLHESTSNKNLMLEQMILLLYRLFIINSEQSIEAERLPYTKKSTRDEIFKRLYNVKDYVSSCFNENISLDDLSKIACLNSHYLLREFKKFFKLTPYQYLTSVRMNEARKLLVNTESPVSEISALVGFEYLSSFTNLFVKHFKNSPRKYRELNARKSQF